MPAESRDTEPTDSVRFDEEVLLVTRGVSVSTAVDWWNVYVHGLPED